MFLLWCEDIAHSSLAWRDHGSVSLSGLLLEYFQNSLWESVYLLLLCTFHTEDHAPRGCDIPSLQHDAGRLMAHVAENWGMTRWMSSVNTVWACVVGTALPFIFVLPNTSLNDLFHLWNGYLVETARFNSLRGKTQKNINSTCLLCCERNPFTAPQGLHKTTYGACILRINACQVKIIWSIPQQTTFFMPRNGRMRAKV